MAVGPSGGRGARRGDPGSSLVLGQLPADPCHSAPFLPRLLRAHHLFKRTQKKNQHYFACCYAPSSVIRISPPAHVAFFLPLLPRPVPAVPARHEVHLPGPGCHVCSHRFSELPGNQNALPPPTNQRERATLFRVLGRRKAALVIRLTIEQRLIFFLMPVTRGVSTHGAPINLP